MMRSFTQFLLLLCLLPGLAARAQSLDPTFLPTVLKGGPGITAVRVLAVQADGKALVAGDYDFVGGVLSNKVLRLNANGSRDVSFQTSSGANGQVVVLVIQPDGKILIGGGFTGYDGTVTGPLARLNANGSLDTSFAAPSLLAGSTTAYVDAIAVQPDGKIVVGGIELGGAVTGRNLTRLNADGTVDLSFGVGSGAGGDVVTAVLVQADSKIVVGGSFASFNGGSTNGLVRLNPNGSTDTGFNAGGRGTGGFSSVRTLAQQPDGKLLAGGSFTTYNGTAAPRLMRLLATGAMDNTFQVGTGPNSTVYRVRLRSTGELLITGSFSMVNGQRFGNVMRLSATGIPDATFGTAGGSGAACTDVVELPSGQVLAGGDFTTYPTSATTRANVPFLVRLSSTGGLDQSFNLNLETRGVVNGVTPLATGKLLVQGGLTSFNGMAVPNNGFHRLNANGSYDVAISLAALASPTASYIDNFPQPDGSIYSSVADYNGTSTSYTLVRQLANGALDANFRSPLFEHTIPGVTIYIYQVLPQANGTVIVAGGFDTVNGVPRFELARLQANGALDTSFNPAAFWNGQGNLYQVVPEPGGTYLLNWYHRTSLAEPPQRLDRLDANGNRDPTFVLGGNFTGPNVTFFTSLLVQPNGRILVTGNFTGYNGTPTPTGIVRLMASGVVDIGFTPGAAGHLLVVQPDGRLLLKTNPYLPTSALVRLNANGSMDTSFPAVGVSATGFFNRFWYVVLQPQDNKILLYGGFTTVAGQLRVGLARLNNTLLPTAAPTAEPAATLYPNPAHGSATLALPAAPTARPMLLLDGTGRELRRLTLPAQVSSLPLDLRGLPAGLYLVRCGTATQRLVVE